MMISKPHALITQHKQLQANQEWRSILRATGYGKSFHDWLRGHPEVDMVPSQPTPAYLHDLEQLVRFDLDHWVHLQTKQTQQHAKFLQDRDLQRYGKQQAFRRIREATPGLVNMLDRLVTVAARITQPLQHGLVELALDVSQPFDLRRPIEVHGSLGHIMDAGDHSLVVMMEDAEVPLPSSCQVTQQQLTMDPPTVADKLQQHWEQYWNRDSPEELSDPDLWPTVTRFLDEVGHPHQVTSLDAHLTLSDVRIGLHKMSSKTSRGCCGWAVDDLRMLRDNGLQALTDIFNNLDHMPSELMQARVIPLAKRRWATDPSLTRPITVLAVLYRLWGAITSVKILRSWQHWLPGAITGFVPGRSPALTLYRLQYQLERAQRRRTPLSMSGVTLDIRKCFNGVPRLPVQLILQHLQVPSSWVNFWKGSIDQMIRLWQVDSSLIPTTVTTTGIPEGDSWSVVGMICLNWLWVTLFEQRMPEVHPHAFADNWSYHTLDPGNHHGALTCYVDFTTALKLCIDWDKTWGWTSDRSHVDPLLQAASQVLPQALTLELVPYAKELGHILHYRKRQHRQPQNERHQATLIRLKKLAHHSIPLPDKARIVQAACLSKALFGVHTYYVGAKYFSDLRTAITRCLVGPHHNSNPYVGTMVFHEPLLDPELVVILQALKAARCFLVTLAPEQAHVFLADVAHYTGSEVAATGPAAALNLYLAKLSWQLTSQGNLVLPGSPDLHILQTNWPELVQQAKDSWMEHVSVQLLTRKGLRGIPPIDRSATIRVFQQLPESHQSTISVALVGGYMLNEQKRHFDDHDGSCELCGLADSHVHRTLECPATDHVRARHATTVTELVDQPRELLQLPVIFMPPMDELIKHIRATFPAPVMHATSDQLPAFVYTDGSCYHNADPRSSYATYAAVFPVQPYEVLQDLALQGPAYLLQHGYSVLCVNHVTGAATVPRAELMAMVAVHELGADITVVTDSAYVMNIHDRVVRTPRAHHLHLEPNFDLILRLHRVIWDRRLPAAVLKVRAHQDLHQGTKEERLHRMGNAAADEAAKQGARTLMRAFTAQLDEQAQQRKRDMQLLAAHFSLLYDLGVHRLHLQQPDQQVQIHQEPTDFLQRLLDWQPDSTEVFVLPDHLDLEDRLHCSHWGTAFSDLVIQWLASLRWPATMDGMQTGAPPIGITWFELALNFWLLTQRAPLVNIPQDGRTCWVDPLAQTAYAVDQFAFTQLTYSLHKCVTHLESICGQKLMPSKRSKVTSLHWLGLRGFRQGIPYRPILREQAHTMQLMAAYLRDQQDRGETGLHTMPSLPEREPLFVSRFSDPPGDTPGDRQARLRALRARFKTDQAETNPDD
eukprot:Skav205009  [mRNA]  locus=scaffold2134:72552:76577:- [translate_table: standard]